MLHKLGLAGSGRPPKENVHARAVRIVPVLLAVPEIPHSLHNPVERDVTFDVQSVQGVVLRRHERIVLRLRLHEFAMWFHKGLDERGYLVLARTHPLDVLQNHRDAARACLVLLRELFGELCGDKPFKPELLHAVAPNGRTLARTELVETDRVVETTPDGIIQRPCRGIRYPYRRQLCLIENRVDYAFFGTRRTHTAEQRRKEVHARAEELVGLVDHYHAPFAWHLIVADPNPGHPALWRIVFTIAVALAYFKEIEAEFLCERLRKARLASSRLTVEENVHAALARLSGRYHAPQNSAMLLSELPVVVPRQGVISRCLLVELPLKHLPVAVVEVISERTSAEVSVGIQNFKLAQNSVRRHCFRNCAHGSIRRHRVEQLDIMTTAATSA